MRLDQYLVAYTEYTRREVYEQLNQGAIQCNGRVCQTLRITIDPAVDRISIRGVRVTGIIGMAIYRYHKPVGVISTMTDPRGRPCLADVCRSIPEPVFPVGRLDRDTSGLLLLTNDGQLANQILHPRYQIDKQYVVQLAHAVTASDNRRLLGGLFLDDGPVRLTRLESLSKNRYRVVIAQGRNRIIRRLFDTLGYRVIALHRDTIGPIQLGRLAVGQVDALNYQKTLTMIMETDG